MKFLLISYFSSSNFAIQKKNSLEAARLQIQQEKKKKKKQAEWQLTTQVSPAFGKSTLCHFAFTEDLP